MKSKSMEFLTEAVGWYGVVAILIAYGLLSLGYVDSSSVAYHVLNFTGGIGIIVDAIADRDAQPVVLNLIWVIFALIAILKIVI